METNKQPNKKRSALFVAIGCLMIVLGNAISFVEPLPDFWRGFFHGFSILANLVGVVFCISAWWLAKRESHEQKNMENEELEHVVEE